MRPADPWESGDDPPDPPPAASSPWPTQRPAAADPDGLLRRQQHGDPLTRRMGQGVRRMVGSTATPEAGDLNALAARLQQAVTTGRRIAVTSIRGGAGKSTAAALASSVLAHYRGDLVLVVDADPGVGSLSLRLGVQSEYALRDLAAAAPPATFEQLDPYLARYPNGLRVLPGTRGQAAEHELSLATYQAATAAASRFFAVTVVDCGAGLLGELPRGVLSDAHAHALVTPATVDGAVSARQALGWLAGYGFDALLDRTVVVLATHAPDQGTDLDRATRMLGEYGVRVTHLPYDRHLASGSVLNPALLAESTRLTAVQLAADLLGYSLHT